MAGRIVNPGEARPTPVAGAGTALRVLTTIDPIGGIWTYGLDLARGLAAKGFRVTLAVLGPTLDEGRRTLAEQAGLGVVETGLPPEWLARDADEVTATARAVDAIARRLEVDIIHLNHPVLAARVRFPGRVIGVAHSCVATWWDAVHGGDMPPGFAWRTALVAEGYSALDTLLAPSHAFAEATRQRYGLSTLPTIVSNGRAFAETRPLDGPPAAFAFTAGRLWDEAKNMATVDAAAALLKLPVLAAGPTQGPNGEPVALSHCRSLGRLSEAEVAAQLARRPIYVSPALYEPFGLAIVEAAQAGCALVLSDIPSFRELWKGAATFVPALDAVALAGAIQALVDDPAHRRALGAAAARRARLYTTEAMLEGTLAAYRATSIEAPAPASLQDDMTTWRRHLHAEPEFGFEEHRTAAFVAARLRAFGLDEVVEGVGGTGVVGTLRRGTSSRAIALRADMDALRIVEAGTPSYRSKTPGLMHACGHDGHTAMLLGAARMLAEGGGFDGTVRFIFQPAEEWGRGAQAMLDDGLLARFPFDEIYGFHNLPGLPVGHLATRPGPLMAAEDLFEIAIAGQGGHAARPHETRDPLVAASATVLALQTIVSRNTDPAATAVVSITEFLTDGTRNVLPGTARLLGDCRSFDPAVGRTIEAAMRRIADHAAAMHGCTATLTYAREFVALHNAAGPTQALLAVAADVLGPANVDRACAPIAASEDFARFLEHRPGCFAFLGNGVGSAPLHNAAFDFDDRGLIHGAGLHAALARARLQASAD